MNETRGPFRVEPVDAALTYANRGWAVFPCHGVIDDGCACRRDACSSPAKHPLTPHGLRDATLDPGLIQRWWRHWPTANVAIRTGHESQLVVLDIDPGHGGEASLATLVDRYGTLPETLTVETGSGGTHLYFRHPGERVRNSAGTRLGPGLDVRGDGGYVIAPPSRHVSGQRYGWSNEATPAALPAWLLGAVRPRRRVVPPALDRSPPRPTRGAEAWARAALKGELASVRSAPVGRRNDTLNRSAFALGQIVAGGQLGEQLVTELLVDAGQSAGLHESECRATVASGLAAGLERPRTPPQPAVAHGAGRLPTRRPPPSPEIS